MEYFVGNDDCPPRPPWGSGQLSEGLGRGVRVAEMGRNRPRYLVRAALAWSGARFERSPLGATWLRVSPRIEGRFVEDCCGGKGAETCRVFHKH